MPPTRSSERGEVTPEQCHAIGVELARRVWGGRFQVLVATHLNTDCLHNHFVINAVSYVDGEEVRAAPGTIPGDAPGFRPTVPGTRPVGHPAARRQKAPAAL